MDQRLSILDQLEQGLRVLDFEVASLESSGWICNKNFFSNQSNSCKEHYTLHGRCFSNCPFIVSHGNLEESIGLGMGYTFPEKLFASVAEFVAANPLEVVTLVLLGTHGNAFPSEEAVVERLNSTGLLQFVYNFDPVTGKQVDLADNYPTLRAMRATKKTVLVVTNKGPDWHIAHSNASLISGSDTAGTCTHPKTKVQTRCLELWDSITVGNLSPNQAVLDQSNIHGLFAIPNLSSRRGRADNNTSYTRLPNIRHDFPFVAGGNPAQASAAANGSHIRQLEKRWAELLEPYGQVPNWILVDFFNTTTAGAPKESSRTLLPNTAEGEGLVDTVREFLLRLDGAASREASLLSAHDENGFTPLHLAAGMNCVEIVNLIAAHVKDNPNTGPKHPLNFVGPDGYSAAHFAAAKNNDRIIYLLGKHGSNIDYKNDNGETPLYIAAKFGHSAALNTLLQLNARVNEPNKDGETPAFVAAANGNFLIINRLVQHKDVDIDRAQTLGATPLLIASQNGNVNIVRALLEAGAQVDVPKHDDNSTALIMAAQEGHTNICELLLEHKASSRKENSFHSTALCVAAASGHADIVRMLLAKGGANPNHQEDGGVTPMHLACEAGFVEVLQTLLEHGGEYEKKRLDGRTCLEIAVIHNQLSCLKHIMETVSNDLARKYGATPKKKKNTLPGYLNSLVATDGVTVLLSCIQHFDIEIARYLVYRGKVDVTQKNSITGEMPITFAAEQNKIAVVDLLIKEAKLKGESIVNSARKSGSTALHIACTHGHLKLVEYLLGVEEIDINRQSAIGMTPLMEAAKGRHGKIVKVLASNPACNMNIVSSIGLSALHCSVVAQDIASVEAILRSKKGKIMPKKSGTNCLHSSRDMVD
eukprot:g4913.t1